LAKGRFDGDKLDLLALRNIALQLPLPSNAHQVLQAHKITGTVNALHIDWAEQNMALAYWAHGQIIGRVVAEMDNEIVNFAEWDKISIDAMLGVIRKRT